MLCLATLVSDLGPCSSTHSYVARLLVHVQVRDNIAVHIPCSSKKMGIEESFMKVGGRVGWGRSWPVAFLWMQRLRDAAVGSSGLGHALHLNTIHQQLPAHLRL